MEMNNMNTPCKDYQGQNDQLSLTAETEILKLELAQKEENILTLEADLVKSSLQTTSLSQQVSTWREKYDRLHDSHKRLQKLNQVLEDKLLQMVEKMKLEKSQLTKDIATLSVRLADSKHSYSLLQKENERYKNDMNLAIQLLQCKPDNFVAQKLESLPVDTQARVSQYVMSKAKSSGSQTKNSAEIESFDASEYEFNISASLMSKILEDSIQDTLTKHCDTCTCAQANSKPFTYNDSHYSMATQTLHSGEINNLSCHNCNGDIKSLRSNMSIGSASPSVVKILNEKVPHRAKGPMYIIPQPKVKPSAACDNTVIETENLEMFNKSGDKHKLEASVHNSIISRIGDDLQKLRINNGMDMEPSMHHKLCDRTKTPVSSMIGSTTSLAVEETLFADVPNMREKKHENQSIDDDKLRKGSQSSMGDASRTSSVAKSMSSTQKSNTHVGPGPRFCSLRMQAGSKNILLDNAQPDVPPILYKRQNRDLNDDFVGVDKKEEDIADYLKKENETTLIDVHVENLNKDLEAMTKSHNINPVLLNNVSSSPLEPLKAHTMSSGSEKNNNKGSSEPLQKFTDIENLLNLNIKDREGNIISSKSDTLPEDHTEKLLELEPYAQRNRNTQFTRPIRKVDMSQLSGLENTKISKDQDQNTAATNDISTNDTNEIKIFNFERYEQSKLSAQYGHRPLNSIDMSQLYGLENTKIAKDPQDALLNTVRKTDDSIHKAASIQPNINVYTNLSQGHKKTNDTTTGSTQKQSTSSLSSDDGAAVLHKQQLLRVAEWVERNLEQNSYNDPSSMDEDANFGDNATRDANIYGKPGSLEEPVLNMPHPVSKYSKSYAKKDNTNHVQRSELPKTSMDDMASGKETVFPVECNEASVTVCQGNGPTAGAVNDDGYKLTVFGVEKICHEELERMEYNVKQFLMGGSYWEPPRREPERGRRTSSKTETDV